MTTDMAAPWGMVAWTDLLYSRYAAENRVQRAKFDAQRSWRSNEFCRSTVDSRNGSRHSNKRISSIVEVIGGDDLIDQKKREETRMRIWVLVGALLIAFTGASRAQDAAAGQAAFTKYICQVCHDAGEGAKIKVGPPLNGLDGRKAGTYPGFGYSDAFKEANVTWSEATFKEYITNPAKMIPNNRMAIPGVADEKDRANLWAYLKQFDADGKKK
jgi:cytochrome c